MTCPACGQANRAGRKFCAACGGALALVCGACGAPHEAGEKFCGECGTALSAIPSRQPGRADPRGAADADARKVVTIVFADLVGSTALHERLDAESARRLMERYYAVIRGAVDAHGGTVVKLLGDGVMAAFGLRQVAEDDAIRAVRAAVAMHQAFRALAGTDATSLMGMGLRVGVNTGEVVVSGAEDDVIGDPVNVAARLQEQGRDGDVVVGEATRRLVATRVTLAPLGSVSLKGRAEAVAAYRVESLEATAAAAAAPFVGRDDELARLRAVYEAAVATPAARLAVLLGSPGLGKSRLIDELGHQLGAAATVLAAHCDAAGGATFAPLAAALRALLGIDDAAGADAIRATIESALSGDDVPDRPRIAGGIATLLAGSPAAPEETFFVVRRLLGALAHRKPLLLVIDDLHWAEPLLLDLVEHLIQWGSGVPLLVLVGARPELRDLRSALVTPGGLVSDVVTLGGLDADAATRFAAGVIGASDLPAAVAAKVLATSEGNPLFVGELVRMLVQEGALTKEGERWTAGAGLASIEMPPTIHALLAARIERLGPEERTVLERASVVGRHFSRGAVAALLRRNGTELDARLEALRRSELIERDPGWLLGEPALRFHHVLIRDAAYRRLLKGTRAELHERLADWIEAQVEAAPEHDETVGRHLEQAHQLLRELGPVDAHGRALGERAAHRLAAAGRRALARDDVPVAGGLLGRAIDRLDPADRARADLALDWCEALLSAGDVGPAASAIAEVARFAEGSDRLRGWHTCFAGQLAVMTAPEELHAVAERVAGAARDLAKLDDAAGEAKAHFVHAQALARVGKVGASEAALDQALAAARRAGDRRRANAVLAGAPHAALWGPSPVPRASGRCLDVVRVLRITQGAPAVEAVALSCQGVLEALRGRTDAARRMLASSRAMVEELGITQRLYEIDVFIGRVDLLEGDAAAAERRLRPAYDGLRELGLGIDAARVAALLGRALLAQGRAAEADVLSHESEMLAGDDLQAAIAWRGVRGEALAARGEHAAAVALAQAAVGIAAATDALLDHAEARVALAAALGAAGRRVEADAEARLAIELWEKKGATLLAEGAGRVSAESEPAAAVGSAESVPGAPASRRRVRANGGTFGIERLRAAVAARNAAALAQLFDESMQVVHHPTGATYGRREMVATWRSLLRADRLDIRAEILASLGDALELDRHVFTFQGLTEAHLADVGLGELEEISLIEADQGGRWMRAEFFGPEHLHKAVVRLYERHAERLPDGPARERAAAMLRVVNAVLGPLGLDRIAAIVGPHLDFADHRRLGLPSSHGRAGHLQSLGALFEASDDLANRLEGILALGPDAFVFRLTNCGTDRTSGGAFERPLLFLAARGADGLTTHWEFFDVDCEADALARFDVLTGARDAERHDETPIVDPLANAATRALDRGLAALAARDWPGFVALFAEDFRVVDRTSMGRFESDGPTSLGGFRHMIEMTSGPPTCRVLATRGERLALARVLWRGAAGDVGPSEVEWLVVIEVDERGDHRLTVSFNPIELDAAYADLQTRYEAGEAAGYPTLVSDFVRDEAFARFAELANVPRVSPAASAKRNAATVALERWRDAFHARDWDAFRALFVPDGWFEDRRRQFLLSGDAAWMISVLRDAAGASPDLRAELQVLGTAGERVDLERVLWVAGPPEGRFEVEYLTVNEVDEAGRVSASISFDPDNTRGAQREAWARWAAIEPAVAPSVALLGRVLDAVDTHDLAAYVATLADEVIVVDHRRTGVGRIEGAAAYAASMEAGGRLAQGGHAELGWHCPAYGRHGVVTVVRIAGAYESEHLEVLAHARGRFTNIEMFELEDLDAALARFEELRPDPLP
jgi:class 3 adenylate cyclase